jgi:hypothetical protein
MVGTEMEDAFVQTLPDGFKTTFAGESRLRRLSEQDPNAVLGDTVSDFNGNRLTEREIINNLADRVNTSFTLPERTIELPGLMLALDPSAVPGDGSLLEQWVALYLQDNSTPTGTVKDPKRASTDDIVFSFATPEVYNQVNDNGGSTPNFVRSGLSGGDTLQVVGEGGIDSANNSDGGTLSLADDEYLFFTGDFIDLSDGKSVVTATEAANVDDQSYGPSSYIFQNRLSGAHLLTTQGFYVTDRVDVDAKVYEGGDTELVPVAFYLGDGSRTPDLV